MSVPEAIGWVFIGFGLMLFVALLYIIPFYFMWNWLMPELFNLPRITLLQSFGLLLLSGMFFRSGGSNCKK